MQESLKVEGMTCQHCVKTITDGLNDKAGIYKVEVHLDKKEVEIEYNEEKINLEQIYSRIRALGFELVND